MADLDPNLRDELEGYGRMCALTMIQLGQGAPAIAILGGALGMRKRLDRLIPMLEANPDALVQVNPHIGEHTADFLASELGDEVPDFPPEDLR